MSSKRKLRERRLKKKRMIFNSFFLLLFFSAILFFFLSPYFFISSIIVSSNSSDVYSEDILKDFLENEYMNRYMFFFPRKNMILSRISLRKNIQSQFPQFDDIHINHFSKTLSVSFSKRKPIAVVCDGFSPTEEVILEKEDLQKEEKSEGKTEKEEVPQKEFYCYFIDKHAMIFSEAPYFTDPLFMKFYIDDSWKLEKGIPLLKESRFQAILSLVKNLKEKQYLSPRFISLKRRSDDNSYIDLTISTDLLFGRKLEKPCLIFMRLDGEQDFEENMLQKFEILKNTNLFKKEFFREKKNIASIDFRIPKQIRYSLDNEIQKEHARQ